MNKVENFQESIDGTEKKKSAPVKRKQVSHHADP